MSDPLKIVLQKVREHLDSHKEHVFTGIQEFGSYQKACGVIYGLGLAEREIIDLLNVMERNDE